MTPSTKQEAERAYEKWCGDHLSGTGNSLSRQVFMAGYDAARATPSEPASAPAVKVERNRVWIVKGVQSFMLAYEADTDEELQWYAAQVRGILSGITPDVKSAQQAGDALDGVTPDAQEVLADIFTNSERPDKMSLTLDRRSCSITVKYEDLDDEWFKELAAAILVQREGDV